jgi:MFS family permease
MTSPAMTDPDRARHVRNLAVFTVGESFWGFQQALVASSTVLILLLRAYGAGERMIGTVGAIETAAVIFPQILGMYLFRSRRRRKRQIVAWHVLAMLPFLFLIGIVILLGDGRLPRAAMAWLLLGLFGCYMTAMGVIIAVWMEWLASIFPQRMRGMAMGLSFGCSAALGTAGGLLAGWILRHGVGTAMYGWLYLAAGTFGTISILCFLCVREEPFVGEDDVRPPALGDLLRLFRHSLGEPNFRNFLVGRLLATAGFSVMPFVALYYASAAGGGVAPGTIVACGAAATAVTAVGNLAFGRIGDRHGHRWGILAGTGGQLLALAVMLTGRGQLACILTYAAAGIAIAAAVTSHANLVFETCPHDNRLAHITLGSLVMAISSVSCPLLAGLVAHQWGMRALFAASALVSLVALAWLALRVRDPRSISLAEARSLCDPGPTAG